MAKGKQGDLPGMENRKLKDLHEAAMDYADVRDRRQELNKEEVELKSKLLRLMKQHKMEKYEYEDVSIWIEIEEETVKVRVRKPKEEEEAA
jgi:hypothetical protein